MSAHLHMVDLVKDDSYPFGYVDDPGAVFRCEEMDTEGHEAYGIVLPNRAGIWFTNHIASDGQTWTITGEVPNITVDPSINAGDDSGEEGNWHGWIKDGVMEP